MLRECPKCGCQQDSFLDVFCCQNPICGAELDFTPYISEEFLKKEGQVIVEGVKGLSPFFKKGDLDEGTKGVIKGEFKPSGKFQNYTGEVDFGGTIMKVSLNKTSLYDLVSKFGNDTSKWVGKEIVHSLEDVETKQGAVYRNVAIFRAVK